AWQELRTHDAAVLRTRDLRPISRVFAWLVTYATMPSKRETISVVNNFRLRLHSTPHQTPESRCRPVRGSESAAEKTGSHSSRRRESTAHVGRQRSPRHLVPESPVLSLFDRGRARRRSSAHGPAHRQSTGELPSARPVHFSN